MRGEEDIHVREIKSKDTYYSGTITIIPFPQTDEEDFRYLFKREASLLLEAMVSKWKVDNERV